MSKWYQRPGQVRILQDEHAKRPTEAPGYAIASLVSSTSPEDMMEYQHQLHDAWTYIANYHEPRNREPEPIEDTDAYVRYAQQMAYQGKEIWND